MPEGCDPAWHLFYVLLPSAELRPRVMATMREQGIATTFHYVPLHDSVGGTRFSATWFERREDATIDWVRDPGSTVFQSRNFQELQFHGGEFEVRQRLQTEAEVGANFTVIRASRLLPEDAVSRYVFTFPRQQLSAIYRGPVGAGFYLKMRLGVFNREFQTTKAIWDASIMYGLGRWRSGRASSAAIEGPVAEL